jgi:membrane-associated phospholipid phosphatase
LKTILIAVVLALSPLEMIPQNLDIRILDAINSPNSLPADNFFKFVSNSAVVINIGVPAGIGAYGLIKNDKTSFNNALENSVATMLCGGITYAIKFTVNRKRPFETYPFITKKTYGGDPSFPSAHTSNAFCTATSLSLAYPKWYVILPSYAWASTVAYSRMHLGVHYPSDLLGGIIVGVGTAYITYKARRWMGMK